MENNLYLRTLTAVHYSQATGPLLLPFFDNVHPSYVCRFLSFFPLATAMRYQSYERRWIAYGAATSLWRYLQLSGSRVLWELRTLLIS
jgi:hypothetical protein